MQSVYIDGSPHRLAATMVIGKGGEADVFDMGDGSVLKLYKRPDDPDYQADVTAQRGADHRLQEHQQKLPAFPSGLPGDVIVPLKLAYDRSQSIVGYTMRYLRNMEVLLRYGDRRYREQGGIDGNQVAAIFRHLHGTVRAVHGQQVVIGDFNDLNVLVEQDRTYLVDADSMQFGRFPCRTFTARFVDPLRCEPSVLILSKGHNTGSDWYAFTTMLFQSLLYVGPYGGVHRPKSGARLQHDARVLKRLTVFDGDVRYPKPALHFGALPDELLEYFRMVYEQDLREVFPSKLLESLRWTTCTVCGATHARPTCPQCAAPGIVKQKIVYRGNVTATQVFHTRGRLLTVVHQGGKLRYLYHEDGAFKRENGVTVVPGQLDPELRYRISGDTTILGKRQRLLVFNDDASRVTADTYGPLSVFDANSRTYFWVQNGQLGRNGQLGFEYIGDVLAGRTLFWTGEKFGLGFYQAGQLMRTFVFNTSGRGLNDQVDIPSFPGQLVDTTCVFSDHLAWFFVTLQLQGRLENRCYVVNDRGEVLAQAAANQEEDSWLSVGIRGRFAAGKALFVPTDRGIVRVEPDHGTLSVTQEFPDTEPFVTGTSHLLTGDGGIYVVSGDSREITHVTIK